MIQLFILPSSHSSRKAKAHLIETGASFVLRDMKTHPMTFEELKLMLHYTEEGTDELISRRSLKVKAMQQEGIDFDELSLRELHQLMCQHPSIVRAPIALGTHTMVVGYEQDRYNVFKPRALRMEEHQAYLDILRADEDIRFAEKLRLQQQQEQEEFELSI